MVVLHRFDCIYVALKCIFFSLLLAMKQYDMLRVTGTLEFNLFPTLAREKGVYSLKLITLM